MKPRRFSRRDDALVDHMIQTIGRDLSLPAAYDDEARSIGWCAFLSVYQKYPLLFRWTGNNGWARVYEELYAELSAFKTQEASSKYYSLSLDRPITQDDSTPLQALLRTRYADFSPHICLWDYLQHLPPDESWLAKTLSSGYTSDEIPILFHCAPEELAQIHRRLQESMTHYLEI